MNSSKLQLPRVGLGVKESNLEMLSERLAMSGLASYGVQQSPAGDGTAASPTRANRHVQPDTDPQLFGNGECRIPPQLQPAHLPVGCLSLSRRTDFFWLTIIRPSRHYRWPAEWPKKTAQLLQRMKWPRLRLRSCCRLVNERYSSRDHGRDGEAFV
jgi:hypothetical protein